MKTMFRINFEAAERKLSKVGKNLSQIFVTLTYYDLTTVKKKISGLYDIEQSASSVKISQDHFLHGDDPFHYIFCLEVEITAFKSCPRSPAKGGSRRIVPQCCQILFEIVFRFVSSLISRNGL